MAKDPQFLRDHLVDYATKLIGTFVSWGGDDIFGRDCSGFNHELLQGAGLEARGFDSTAHGLYTRLKDEGYKEIEQGNGYPGCLVFWFRSDLAIHTAIIAKRNFIIIHAAGASSPSKTPEELIKSDSILSALIKKTENLATKSPAIYWLLKKLINFIDSDNRNAFVRYDDIDYRGDNYQIIDPTQKATE